LFLPDRSFFHETFQARQGRTAYARARMGTDLSAVAGPGDTGFWKRWRDQYPASGNYPGTGSSPQPGVPPPALAPSGPSPGSGNNGARHTPISGNYPGSGSSPQPGVPPPALVPSGPSPGSGNNGARHTPISGNYPVQVPRRNRVFHHPRLSLQGHRRAPETMVLGIPRQMVSRPDLAPLPIPRIRACLSRETARTIWGEHPMGANVVSAYLHF